GDYHTGGHHPQKYPNTGMDGKSAYSLNTGLNFLEEHRIGVALHGVQTEHAGSPGAFYDIDRKTFLDMASSSCDLLYDGGYKDLGFSWKGRFFFCNDEHANDFKHPADMNAWGDPRQLYFHALNDYQGAQGQLSVKKSVLTLTGGVDWLSSDTDKKGSSYVYNEKYAYGNLGVFALAKIALFDDRLIVSGGVRNETYRMETSGNNLERKKKSDKLDKTVPSFGVAFHVAEWLTMKGNYGEAYRIPNGLELMGFQGSVYPTLPNPDLKPEEARSYDAGFEIRHKSLQIGLSYFETEYKKKIITMYTPPTWEAQSVNADGKIWMKGFEGNAGYDLGEAFGRPFKLRPYVNFTALTECWAASGENSSYSSVYKNKVPLVNDLEMGYGVQFAHPEVGFEADLRLTYVGYHYEQDWNETSPTYGQVVREGGKTIADLFLRQKIYSTDKAGTLSVYGEVRNILNERHALIKDYPMPGRSVFIGLRYDY
ncbi:MAG: TonB-dependent receptor, partial [Deltaproteobacteria bacterium]|nr:TonB-dependent receptor [Deltaproteobacteria bacterium]